jgi:hypothetical protein
MQFVETESEEPERRIQEGPGEVGTRTEYSLEESIDC